jgi:heme exporter protein C
MVRVIVAPKAPPSESRTGGLVRDGLLVVSAVLMLAVLYLVFFWVPSDANLGVSQRILYFHVPVAILGLSSILVVAGASAIHLVTKNDKWDFLAYAAAELGTVLTSMAIVTGAIWAKPVWGVWWTWDPKLTLTLILWFTYVSYLMLRAYGPKGSQGARYGTVVALFGAINAPIVYYAAELWRTTHPNLVVGPAAESGSLPSDMAVVLLLSTLTFILISAYLLIERYSLKRSEAVVDELYQHIS